MTIKAKYLVYMLTAAVLVIILMIGWVLRENHIHQQELADAVVFRQRQVNQFLRTEVCERLELRDEIQISYLRAAASKYAVSDPVYSDVLSGAAVALEQSQRGCRANLPDVEALRPDGNG